MGSNERVFSEDDPALRPGWMLLEFLMGIGADEFAVRFLYAGKEKERCDRLKAKLDIASIGERRRECTVWQENDRWREIEVWRLDRESVEMLKEVMPGVMGLVDWEGAWAEDLCVYRGWELVFGTVTHERWAFLRLSEDQWRRWEEFRRERRADGAG